MLADSLHHIMHQLDNAAQAARRPCPRLLAVAKTRSAAEVAELATAIGQLPGTGAPAFGENYVQEAAARQVALGDAARSLEWHLIGHLQSNKAKDAAELFDWVQTVDRAKLVKALGRHRDPARGPLNVLVQANVDDEDSKHGCRPEDVASLAASVAAEPMLRLRGLMVIPAPQADPDACRPAFQRSKALFDAMRAAHPQVDTLSMGMSGDMAVAVEEGSTMVRIGTALFGPRPARPD